MFRLILSAGMALAICPAFAHDIYSGIHGKGNQLCCGGDDCSATIYRENGARYEFLTRENAWVAIPQDRITFLPIPGDDPAAPANRAHLCYRQLQPMDQTNNPEHVFGDIFLYCAYIPPGAT